MSSTTNSLTDSEVYIRDFLSSHSSFDAELGDVEVMTDRYTNTEWAKQIAETQRKVLREVEQRKKEGGKGWKYDIPRTASGEFAKVVDHTVLKLDAKEAQIDSLCSEARTEGFKVGKTVILISSKRRGYGNCENYVLICANYSGSSFY